jgi:hypothetical protein
MGTCRGTNVGHSGLPMFFTFRARNDDGTHPKFRNLCHIGNTYLWPDKCVGIKLGRLHFEWS